MRVREHFLLSTEKVTVSATAKTDCDRETLFHNTVETVLSRYQEEFGTEACRAFVQALADSNRENVTWKIRPEDSCWNQVKKE